MSARHAHFTVFMTGVGYHESAWRLADPADLAGPGRFGVLERSALAAERGLLDAVFFADSPGLAIFRARYFPQVGFDPLELLAALSRTTTRIGLIATASTTYSAPYDLARRFATIDHLSGGRAGWNIVTTRYTGAAATSGSRHTLIPRTVTHGPRSSSTLSRGCGTAGMPTRSPTTRKRASGRTPT